ncbi:hypothetical protein [Sphaerotilus sp.]|uniref:hypothetical protein n=1 Tax=Sphaerotilus sp. TaxID=2093942 RepID=UPI00286E9186|nr:hypothetical protein [Sphaerotilus sp.]
MPSIQTLQRLSTAAAVAMATLALTPATAQVNASTPPMDSLCPPGTLVDAAFRDAAVLTMRQLVVRAPGQPSHGAVRRALAAAHIDSQKRPWHHIAAYEGNLGLIGALRVDPSLRTEAADWLRWQVRHLPLRGIDQGVLHDRWVLADGSQESMCPPDIDARHCNQIDATDSTIASLFVMAKAYLDNGGDVALLREPAVRLALERAAATLLRLQQANGLSWAKRSHPVAYLMDAVEVAAGWRALAHLQDKVWAQPQAAQTSRDRAQRAGSGVEQQLWDAGAGLWRVSQDAPSAQTSRWYPDTMAQAWPLLWSSASQPTSFSASRSAWPRAAAQWRTNDNAWQARNVDPAGFWWPAAAVAAHCVGDTAAAVDWVTRARAAWLKPSAPFAWPFQVSDLLWLLWLAEPGPPQAPLPTPMTTLPATGKGG